ncbi:EMILIN-1-like [Carcharodon carcharias]|uniref:EMILIN-1-like n=1 Tax=Carcharodon carcharias TaxID=13397 RepID=UPI001B7E5781|nr:EMILIN-1-like [Carcharodon carcharias]
MAGKLWQTFKEGKSDHNTIEFYSQFDDEKLGPKTGVFNLNKGNYKGIMAQSAAVDGFPRTVIYRSFMKPRYKIAYKMVTEMEWRCCHGYSGDDCSMGPAGQTEVVSPRPRQPHPSGTRQSAGSPAEGGRDSDKSHQMEEKIQKLSQEIHNLQSTIRGMNEKFQEEMRKAIEVAMNGRQPADAASHPDMKETINEIQRKLHQIDNRVKEHDDEIDLLNTVKPTGTAGGQSETGQKWSDLKGELVREVERRVQNSCFSCRADIELLRQQQKEDAQRLRELGRIFNATEQHNRHLIESIHKHISGMPGSEAKPCCGEIDSTKAKVEDVERKLTSLSDVVGALNQRLDQQLLHSSSGISPWNDQFHKQLQHIEQRLNSTEKNIEKRLMSHLKNLRHEFGDKINGNEERVNTVVSILGNGTAFNDWVRDTVTGLGEDIAKLKNTVGQDGENLLSVVSSVHELESKVHVAVNGCAEICSSPHVTVTDADQNTSDILDVLTKLQRKILKDEVHIQNFGPSIHNLTMEGNSFKNMLQQFRQEVKQLRSMMHSNEEQVNQISSNLRDLESKVQSSIESSLTVCNTIKGEVLLGRNETDRRVSKLTEELDKLKERVGHSENNCSFICSTIQKELTRLNEELMDPAKYYKDLLFKIETFNKTLNGLGIFGGNLGVELGSMQGELRDVILTFNSINSTLQVLQDSIDQQSHNTDMLNTTFSESTNRLITDISKIQEEITDHIEGTNNKFINFQNELGKFSSHMVVEIDECRDSNEGLRQRVSKLENICFKLDSVSQSLEKIKEGLNRHVSSLWNCQRELNTTLQMHSGMLQNIQDNHLGLLKQKITTLNQSVADIYTEIHDFTSQDFIGIEGPPGPPGPQGPAGEDAFIERISFSAALTTPQLNPGTILFDKVLVNEGSHYDPSTGIFTVPYDGRYFISAILTGHRNQRIEAVLAKSNTGLARIDSGGFQPEGLENRPVVGAQPISGSLGIFNIILPLRQGDTVCIDLVTGKLAHSDEPLTVFNGVLLYEDEDI